MPPEFDHFRTRRSNFDPFLLKIDAKPPPIVALDPPPVVVATENRYYKDLRFVGFEVQGLDDKTSRTFSEPMVISGKKVIGLIRRGELFELRYVVQRYGDSDAKYFGEFAFINDRMEIPTAHGFTAAKQMEIMPDILPTNSYRKDGFTFKIPNFIPAGVYTLAVKVNRASRQIRGSYQGKPIHSLKPVQTLLPWMGQREYRKLGNLLVQ